MYVGMWLFERLLTTSHKLESVRAILDELGRADVTHLRKVEYYHMHLIV